MKLIWISLLFAMVVLAGCTEERAPEPAPAEQPPAEAPPAEEPAEPEPTHSGATCSDTDGDNKFTKGTVIVMDGEREEYVDYCLSASTLKEYICTSESTKGEKEYECICENGACQPEVTHVECVDTDGGQDRFVYGEAYLLTYYSDGTTEKGEVFSDKCILETNKMYEYYCEGDEIRKLTIACAGCNAGVCPHQ